MNMLLVGTVSTERSHNDSMLKLDVANFEGLKELGDGSFGLSRNNKHFWENVLWK